MRTIENAYAEIKESDPNTDLTPRALRRMVTECEIPSVTVGNKYLLNMDLLLDKLSCSTYNEDAICVSYNL